ncbi:MAG TPA: 5'/3'-nucleotidase SurE [Chloroflexi bacterium]|nr:5'/3'-nucleotidase SurE [Chloroflexota bacterium]
MRTKGSCVRVAPRALKGAVIRSFFLLETFLNTVKPQILLTNDDGILSPGLWAAAAALEEIGYVHVVAPREQSSGMGRSLPSTSSGIIQPQQLTVNGREWTVYAVDGTPAQAVLHGIFEIVPRKPDLVVSGINYGENLGIGVTVSGTVGAAMEGATAGIPSLAISLETKIEHHLSYSEEVDFSAAAYFSAYFGKLLLERKFPADMDVFKVDVPANATHQTPWELTYISRVRVFESVPPQRTTWDQPARVGYRFSDELYQAPEGSDVHTLRVKRRVSVTPLSLNITSRADFSEIETILRS